MQFWDIIWGDIRRFFQRRSLFALDTRTAKSLRLVAEKRKVSPHDVLEGMVEAAIQGDEEENFTLQCWDTLSERERQVTALICKRMTTKQIAVTMGISPETVKTYVERIMGKFHIHDRETLRKLLSRYDLSPFE